MKKLLYTLIYLLLMQQVSIAESYNEFSIIFKNDAFFNEDKDYTAGLEFSYKRADCDLTYYFGQDVYTPKKKSTVAPVNGEHPYGAWLYMGVSKEARLNEQINNEIMIKLGTIGDNAKGKSINNSIHKVIGASNEKGWGTQVHKNIAYNINLKSYYETPELQYDDYMLRPYLVLDIGNVFTDIGLGVRVDTDINRFVKLYAAGERKYIDKNIFLEGKSKDGSTQYAVKKIDHKNSFNLGFETTYIKDYNIAFEMVFNSKEYETQAKNNHYGILKVTKKF